MTRTIALTTKAVSAQNEITGPHEKVANAIYRLAKKDSIIENGLARVPADAVRKACRSMKPKRFRAILRQLVSAKFVSVRRVKATV